ncbi:CsbD family protein [bacterium]|nr:CsbD family protein [bacterium]
MNWDIVKGKWAQLKGEARKQWGNLTDDDWDRLNGDREKLSGKLQESYGWAKQDAETKIDEFFRPRAEI